MLEKVESDYSWRYGHQIYAAIVANLVLVGHGTIAGWLSPALPVLMSDDTPLVTGPITNEELSWIGSISSIGSIIGTLIFGVLSSMLGCKRAMMFLALPSITFWSLIHFGDTFFHVLFARLAMGLTAGGVQCGIIIYVAEIANDNVRGRLGSLTPLARNIGVLVAYIIGATVEYDLIPAIFICIPIAYMICLFFLPNSPQYHLKVGDEEEAEKSLKYYKCFKGDTKEELNAFQLEFERLKMASGEAAVNKFSWRDFVNRPAARGMIVATAMAWFLQMTGCFTFMSYASLIFQESGTELDNHLSAIILAVVQIFGGLLSTSFSDKFGRKVILAISLFGSALGLFSTSIYLYLRQSGLNLSDLSILPVICLSFVIFISNAGISPLSNVCAVENMPPKIRTAGMLFYTVWYNFVQFLGDKYFPILLGMIQLPWCLFIFAINCCFGTAFVIFYLKETKGQSLNFTETLDSEKK